MLLDLGHDFLLCLHLELVLLYVLILHLLIPSYKVLLLPDPFYSMNS